MEYPSGIDLRLTPNGKLDMSNALAQNPIIKAYCSYFGISSTLT